MRKRIHRANLRRTRVHRKILGVPTTRKNVQGKKGAQTRKNRAQVHKKPSAGTQKTKTTASKTWRQWCFMRHQQQPLSQTTDGRWGCKFMKGMYWWLCRTHTVFFVLKTSHLKKSVMEKNDWAKMETTMLLAAGTATVAEDRWQIMM